MKITPLRTLALAATAVVALGFSSTSSQAADVSIGIQVGGPPPPPRADRPWARPYRDAVWIGGHNEWINGRWVWVGGYYAYPPHRGAVWIPGRYRHGYWRPGYWR